LTARPWLALARKLCRTEGRVLARVRRLVRAGLVREISAIFDARALGYSSALVALKVLPRRLEAAAGRISRHPGVSHNYRREHELNLWFTLATPPGVELAAEARRLAGRPGVEKLRLLPALRVFKIGVKLDLEVGEADPAGAGPRAGPPRPAARAGAMRPRKLSNRDKALIRLTQQNLPLVEAPFDALAARAGLSAGQLLGWLSKMRNCGAMRRFGAVLRHRRAGFTANPMMVWRVPEERIVEAGRICARCVQVSHCYQRPTYPDWPYNLLAQAHARSRRACKALAARLAKELRALGLTSHALLFSVKEYKKERVRYFAEEN
jgi:DNA-binding Lrp family transcriptional regulator